MAEETASEMIGSAERWLSVDRLAPYLAACGGDYEWSRGYDRADLQRRLLAINTVRNRVAHNERLFDPREPQLSPLAADTDLVALFRVLRPEAAARFHSGETPVEGFLGDNPAPADVRL